MLDFCIKCVYNKRNRIRRGTPVERGEVYMKKNSTLKQDILIILFIFIVIFSIIIIKPISDLDEIWNYNTARAISQGLIPYKDISMITTPVLPMLTAIILKVIANEIIVSRILAAILWTGILFTIYKIFNKVMKEENISLIFTALIGIICRDIYCIDYNVAVLFITLTILYQELKNIENAKKYDKKRDFMMRIACRNCYLYKTKYRCNVSNYSCRI